MMYKLSKCDLNVQFIFDVPQSPTHFPVRAFLAHAYTLPCLNYADRFQNNYAG
jgi:hypothetical protein